MSAVVIPGDDMQMRRRLPASQGTAYPAVSSGNGRCAVHAAIKLYICSRTTSFPDEPGLITGVRGGLASIASDPHRAMILMVRISVGGGLGMFVRK